MIYTNMNYTKLTFDNYPDLTSAGIAPLLDGAMPKTPEMAIADPSNVVRAFTITMKPSRHGDNPYTVRTELRNLLKEYACSARRPLFVEVHSEYTKAMVIHFHGYVVGRKTTVGRMFAEIRRRFGYSLLKEPDNLQGWITYINKENAHPTFHVASA